MPAAITATYEEDSVPNLPAAEDGNDTICEWVSNQTSEQLYSLNGFTHSVKPQDDYESYMYDAIQDLHDDGALNDNDHIVLVDALAFDGYGRIYPNGSINLDGNEYYVCRVSGNGAAIASYETRYMAMHELGHTLGLSHEDGDYDISEASTGATFPDDMTVMSVPYIQTDRSFNACDGFIGGRSDPPSEFCTVSNYVVDKAGSNFLDKYSDGCSRGIVEDHLEGL